MKRCRFNGKIWISLCGVLLLTSALWADGFIIVPHPIPPPRPWPHPWIPPRPTVTPLEVVQHTVKVQIQDQVAVTEVDQVFRNPTAHRLEGTYIFPIPRGATVDRFSLEVDGKLVKAELLSAKKARELYEEIVRRSRDPALLEFVDQGAFRARIFPFPPHGTRRVRLRYTQPLRAENGQVEYVYPLRPEGFSSKPLEKVSIQVDIRGHTRIGTVYSPTHDIKVQRLEARKVRVRWGATQVLPEKDFHLIYALERKGLAVTFLPYREPGEPGHFLLFVAPRTDQEPPGPRDVVFVLDTSGSMAGGKLEQAVKALRYGLETLRPEDRFEIIRFSSEAEALFGRLVRADKEHLTRGRSFLEKLTARGGTAIDEALRRALEVEKQNRPCYIVFLTDGRPTVGVTDITRILQHVKKQIRKGQRLFLFGIGYDVNTRLLDQLAEIGRGATEYVVPEEDLEVKLSRFFDKVRDPVFTDVKLEWQGPVKVRLVYPRRIPDLFRGEEWDLAGEYQGQGNATVIFHVRHRGKAETIRIPLRFPRQARRYAFVPRVWATRHVAYLTDQIRLHGKNPELIQEIIRVAKKYGIVTPYTAYLVHEEETRRGVPLAYQTFPELETNRKMQRLAEQSYRLFQHASSGAGAVGAARAGQVMRKAVRPEAAMAASAAEAMRGVQPPSSTGRSVAKIKILGPGGQIRPMTPEGQTSSKAFQTLLQTVRYIGGRSFRLRDGVWVEIDLTPTEIQQARTIRFGSEEYFALLRQHPEIGPWLALGPQVVFRIDGQVLRIQEQEE